MVTNNLYSVAVKGVEAELTGGEGTKADPFTYVANVTSANNINGTNNWLDVVAESRDADIDIYYGGFDGTLMFSGTGEASDTTTGTVSNNEYWSVVIDGVYFKVSPVITQTAQEMIDAAPAGSTVKLPAGTYDNLTVSQNLVIDGSNGVKLTGVVNVAGASVTNVTIQNCEIEVEGNTNEGCVVSNTTAAADAVVTISNNTFTVADGKTAVCAIYLDAKAGCKYVVTGNTFAGTFTEGAVNVDMSYGISVVEVTDNDFSGVTGAYIHIWNVDWTSLSTDVASANIVTVTY